MLDLGRRRGIGFQACVDQQVDDIGAHQQQAWNQRPYKQVPHGDCFRVENVHIQLGALVGVGEDISQQYQGDGGRNDLAQGARGADGARRERGLIAAAQHAGQ